MIAVITLFFFVFTIHFFFLVIYSLNSFSHLLGSWDGIICVIVSTLIKLRLVVFLSPFFAVSRFCCALNSRPIWLASLQIQLDCEHSHPRITLFFCSFDTLTHAHNLQLAQFVELVASFLSFTLWLSCSILEVALPGFAPGLCRYLSLSHYFTSAGPRALLPGAWLAGVARLAAPFEVDVSNLFVTASILCRLFSLWWWRLAVHLLKPCARQFPFHFIYLLFSFFALSSFRILVSCSITYVIFIDLIINDPFRFIFVTTRRSLIFGLLSVHCVFFCVD